jgi:hypothetical protein
MGNVVRGIEALALRASPCKVSPPVLFNPKTCRVYDCILRRRVDDNEQISGSALSGCFSRMFYIVVYVHFALPRTPDACWEAWPHRSNDPNIPRESMRNRLKRDSRTQEAAKSRPRSRARRCTSSEQQLVRVSKLQFGTRLYIESRARVWTMSFELQSIFDNHRSHVRGCEPSRPCGTPARDLRNLCGSV